MMVYELLVIVWQQVQPISVHIDDKVIGELASDKICQPTWGRGSFPSPAIGTELTMVILIS